MPILEDRQGRVLGGVSEPAVRGRVVKLLAKSAPDLNATFELIWRLLGHCYGVSLPGPATVLTVTKFQGPSSPSRSKANQIRQQRSGFPTSYILLTQET